MINIKKKMIEYMLTVTRADFQLENLKSSTMRATIIRISELPFQNGVSTGTFNKAFPLNTISYVGKPYAKNSNGKTYIFCMIPYF